MALGGDNRHQARMYGRAASAWRGSSSATCWKRLCIYQWPGKINAQHGRPGAGILPRRAHGIEAEIGDRLARHRVRAWRGAHRALALQLAWRRRRKPKIRALAPA